MCIASISILSTGWVTQASIISHKVFGRPKDHRDFGVVAQVELNRHLERFYIVLLKLVFRILKCYLSITNVIM